MNELNQAAEEFLASQRQEKEGARLAISEKLNAFGDSLASQKASHISQLREEGSFTTTLPREVKIPASANLRKNLVAELEKLGATRLIEVLKTYEGQSISWIAKPSDDLSGSTDIVVTATSPTVVLKKAK